MESTGTPAVAEQTRFWNDWNANNREIVVGPISLVQADRIASWLKALGRVDLDILEVGCGAGWMCERLCSFGRVTGTDLADEVIERARTRVPGASFVAGDFTALELPAESFDVVVTMEVLSHIPDQPAFVAKLAALLKPGGLLMLATQNRFVLERSEGVAPQAKGQIRQWVDRVQLRNLLNPHFEVLELSSVFPNWGHRGVLRLVNSPKLNALLARVVPAAQLDRLKERAFLGHTLMTLARKKRC